VRRRATQHFSNRPLTGYRLSMRLQPDLIRALLLDTEGEEKPDLSGWSEDQLVYHSGKLIEAGLLEGAVAHDESGKIISTMATDLSWQGHEFLANLRNEKLWPQVQEQVKKAGGSVSLEILVALGTELARRAVGL